MFSFINSIKNLAFRAIKGFKNLTFTTNIFNGKNVVLNLKVVLNSKEFKIMGFDPKTLTLKVKVKAKPVLGLANKEIEKNLTKFFKRNSGIFFGKKSKNKKILIQNSIRVLEKLKNL